MLRILAFSFLFLLICFSTAAGQSDTVPRVTAPGSGSALQGVVSITGSTDAVGFRYAEISFGYSGGEGGWFLIQQSQAPVREGVLASWDTSTIADGNYRLRIQVFLTSGLVQEMIVGGLRVRNYSAVETATPVPLRTGSIPATPSVRPTLPVATDQPLPTRLPVNPAEIQENGLAFNGIFGAVFILVLGGLLGLYMFSTRK